MESEIRHGSKIGRFVVVAELGSGGMGVVYAAHDRELDRQVALKVMRGAAEEDEDRIRMLREGQAMARVTHPNVITVYEVGSEGSTVFLAQELLDGGTLGQWLEKPHSQDEIIAKFIAAGRGLAAAHAVGLVHRDFKPDNVLLGKDGRVRVSDFGLARAVGYQDALAGPTDRGGGPPRTDINVTRSPMLNQLTRTGAVMGTPMFMAPEQHRGERADARSDQFSFCVALYHALYGDWPYAGKTSVALADAVINGEMQKPPVGANVPKRLRKILLRGLATNAAERYPSMDALLADLAAPPKGSGKLIAIGIAGTVLVFGAALGAFVVLGEKDKPKDDEASKPIPVKPAPAGSLNVDNATVLTESIDMGTLDSAKRLYDADARIAQDKSKASIAHGASAFTLALRGSLTDAEAELKLAEENKGQDPKAIAYANLAGAAIASARGELASALERAKQCSKAFADLEPLMAAMCLQIEGETEAEMGDYTTARKQLDDGLAIARKQKNAERIASLRLALAQLDLDEKQEAFAPDVVETLRKEARARGAVSCEANAFVLATRARLERSETAIALDVLDNLHPENLQFFKVKIMALLAKGQVYGFRGEGDEDGVMGLDMITDAQTDAEKRGYWGLVLEAKLAKVRVMLTQRMDGAADERAKLVAEANAKGYKRIAHIAETYIADPAAEAPPQTPPPQ